MKPGLVSLREAKEKPGYLYQKIWGTAHNVTDELGMTRIARPPGAVIKVLHVEDDPSVAGAIARALQLHGYEVVSAASGDEAIHLIEHGLIPDLILTDYRLPLQMTGDQVITEIETRLGFKPPTILLASLSTREVEKLKSRADRVFTKPTGIDELCREIERLLGKRA